MKSGEAPDPNVQIKAPAPAASAQPAAPVGDLAPAFREACFKNIDALVKATAAFNTPNKGLLVSAVDIYIKVLKSQEAVIKTMANSLTAKNCEFITKIIIDSKKEVFKMGGPKGKEMKEHLMVIEDTFEIFYWFMRSDDPEEFKIMLGENFGTIDFSGSKVRSKDGEHKVWF